MTNPAAPTRTLRQLFLTMLRRLMFATLVITVVAALVGGLTTGTAGLWGALIGGVVGLLFCATTVVTMAMSEGRSPQYLAVAVLGGWLAKMVVIIVVLVVLRPLDFYDRYLLAGTIAAIAIASLTVEMLAVRSARIPVVETSGPDS